MTNTLPQPLVEVMTTDGIPIRIFGQDIYTDTVMRNHDLNDGTFPGETVLVGMTGRYWIDRDGQFLLPQDVRLLTRLEEKPPPPFRLASPLVCLGGVVVTAWDGEQWDSNQGKVDYPTGPVIDPLQPVDEMRIERLLSRVPEMFLFRAHRETLGRHDAIDQDQATRHFGVRLPESLLFERPWGMLCPVGAFAQWYLGFSADDVAVLHVPETVEYQDRLDALAGEQSEADRRLWAAVQAGEQDARREFTDRVEYLGDTGRAALLRGGLRRRIRSLDDSWPSFDQEPKTQPVQVPEQVAYEQASNMLFAVTKPGDLLAGPDPEFQALLAKL